MADTVQNLKIKVTAEGIEHAQSQMNALKSSIAGILSVTAVLTTATLLMNKAYQEAKESIKIGRLVSSTLEATAYSAGLSKNKLQEMADQLQKISNIDDDGILKNLTVSLLTFRNIKGDTFQRAQKAIMDLNSVFGNPNNPQSLQSYAIQVGKALNDPVQGLLALHRVGVSFTASQISMIKNFAETNRLAEAQAIILQELEAEFGNATEAMQDDAIRFKNSWNNMLEAMGKSTLFTVNAIDKALGGMVDKITSNINIDIFDYKAALAEVKKDWKFLTAEERRKEVTDITAQMYKKRDAALSNGRTARAKEIERDIDKISKEWLALDSVMNQQTIARREPKNQTLTNLTEEQKRIKELAAAYRILHPELIKMKIATDEQTIMWGGMFSKLEFGDKTLKAFGKTMTNMPDMKDMDAMEGLDALSDSLTEAEQAWVDFGESIKGMLENQLGNALYTTLMSQANYADKLKEIWHDLANAVISEITRMIAKMAVMTLFNTISGGNIFSVGASVFDAITGLFTSTGGSGMRGSTQNITPVGERSISREIRDGFSRLGNQQPAIQVYVNPRDISRAAEIGTTLRYNYA